MRLSPSLSPSLSRPRLSLTTRTSFCSIASLTHWQAFIGAVSPDRQGWGSPREVVRWGMCLVMFFAWVAVYVSVYVTVRTTLLLLPSSCARA